MLIRRRFSIVAALALSLGCGAATSATSVASGETSSTTTSSAAPIARASAAPTARASAAPSVPRRADAIAVADLDAAFGELVHQAGNARGVREHVTALLGTLGFPPADFDAFTKNEVEPTNFPRRGGNLDGDPDDELVMGFAFTTPEPSPSDDPVAAFQPRFQQALLLVAWLDRSGPDWIPVARKAFHAGGMGPTDVEMDVAEIRSATIRDTAIHIHSGAPPRTEGGYFMVEIYSIEHGKLETIGATGTCGEAAYLHGDAPPLALGCDARERHWNASKFTYE